MYELWHRLRLSAGRRHARSRAHRRCRWLAAALAVALYLLTAPSRLAAAAGEPHGRSRQRRDHVQCRRLRLLPRHAQAGRQAQARRRPCARNPVRNLQGPQHLARPRFGIGAWSEEQFVNAMLRGVGPQRRAPLPGVSLHLLSAHGARRRARPVRVPEDPAGGRCAVRAARAALPVQRAARARPVEAAVSRRQDVRARSRQERRSSTAAPISSRAPATAPSATARATSSAGSSPTAASPAAWMPRARAGCRTSRRTRTASRSGRRRICRSFSSRASSPDGASVGDEMADVVSNTAKLKPEDREAMAAYLKSLPPRPGKAPPKK